jgi:hypothetical protein
MRSASEVHLNILSSPPVVIAEKCYMLCKRKETGGKEAGVLCCQCPSTVTHSYLDRVPLEFKKRYEVLTLVRV